MWIPFVLMSAVLLAFYDVSKKKSVAHNAVMPVLVLGTLVGAVGFSLALAMSGTFTAALLIDAQTFGRVFIKSAIITVSWVFAYYAMRELPFSIAAPIRGSVPFWTLLGALVCFQEIPTWLQGIGMFFVLVGYWRFSVAGKMEGIHFRKNAGILFAFAGTWLGSCSALYDKYLLQTCKVDRLALQLWFEIDLVVLLGLVLLVQRMRRLQRTPFQWRWSIPAVGLLLIAADWFYFAALAEPKVAISIVSMIRRSNVLVSFTLGALFFHERNLKQKAFALAAILLGVAILCLAK